MSICLGFCDKWFCDGCIMMNESIMFILVVGMVFIFFNWAVDMSQLLLSDITELRKIVSVDLPDKTCEHNWYMEDLCTLDGFKWVCELCGEVEDMD